MMTADRTQNCAVDIIISIKNVFVVLAKSAMCRAEWLATGRAEPIDKTL